MGPTVVMAATARAAERLTGEGARALPGSGPAPDESRQCANGGDLALAQRFARHATIPTTVDVYGHLGTEDLVRRMRRAEDRWNGSTGITSNTSDLSEAHEKSQLRDFVRVEGAERTRTAEVVISAVTA